MLKTDELPTKLTIDNLEASLQFQVVYSIASYLVQNLDAEGTIALAQGDTVVFELPSRRIVLKGKNPVPRFDVEPELA
jgi:hypothetical protein